MPLHGTVALRENFFKERNPSEDSGGLAVERCGAGGTADYEAPVVEAGRVFAKPVSDLRLEVGGEKVGWVAVCYRHCDDLLWRNGDRDGGLS